MRTLVDNIGLLATPLGHTARRGQEQGDIYLQEDAYLVIENGRFVEVGQRSGAQPLADRIVDAGGRLVTPGLVDSHTHAVFSGWRQHELPLKLAGKSYLEILQSGGGILSTVAHTRSSSQGELADLGCQRLSRMLAHGTTTCEVKSGYGLTTVDELKMLHAVRDMAARHIVDIVPTFMGAHAVPPEYAAHTDEYVELLCEEMIPQVAAAKLADFCDVFCESGVFTVAESRRILACAREHGLKLKIHADEITACGGAQLAGELQAVSAEHLIHADDEGLAAMAAAGTVAVLLPGTSLYLGEDFARARTMIDREIAVAIATDCNPGSCPTESLQMPMSLAYLKYRLQPAEVLTAVTLNAAAAIERASQIGSIEAGKQGDFVIWEAPDLNFLLYHWGTNQVHSVYKRGQLAFTSKQGV